MAKSDLIKTLPYYGQEKVDGDFIIGEDSIRASQKITSKIFGTTQSNISMHFSNMIQNEVSISSKDHL